MGSTSARATHARQGRQAASSIRRGGQLGEVGPPVIERGSASYNKNNSRKGEADEGAYEGQQLCGLAAVRISGTDGISSLRRATSDEETYYINGRSA